MSGSPALTSLEAVAMHKRWGQQARQILAAQPATSAMVS
jgi:hypothetical protein